MITHDPLLGWLIVLLYLPAFAVCAYVCVRGWLAVKRARLDARRRMPPTYRSHPKHLDRWYAITPRQSGGRVRL